MRLRFPTMAGVLALGLSSLALAAKPVPLPASSPVPASTATALARPGDGCVSGQVAAASDGLVACTSGTWAKAPTPEVAYIRVQTIATQDGRPQAVVNGTMLTPIGVASIYREKASDDLVGHATAMGSDGRAQPPGSASTTVGRNLTLVTTVKGFSPDGKTATVSIDQGLTEGDQHTALSTTLAVPVNTPTALPALHVGPETLVNSITITRLR